jgi:hypothetical protein
VVGLGFELRASYLQSWYYTTLATHLDHFALVILEMGACELFAQENVLFLNVQGYNLPNLNLPSF